MVQGRTEALLGTILREVDTPVWPSQRWAAPTVAFSRALVLERMRISYWALQEAEVSTFQGRPFRLTADGRPGPPPGLHWESSVDRVWGRAASSTPGKALGAARPLLSGN